MRFQRTLARSEDVTPLATDDPPDGLAVMARAPDDLFDRHAFFPEGEDRCVCLLAPQISVILQLLGCRQQSGIDHGGADVRDGVQRVALARALVIEPSVLLMDEPLGALDRQLRKRVQLEIRRLHREFGRTTLFVTHDQEEALAMSDRIGVMRDGRIEQIAKPNDLYQRPANVFVASFLGESNILNGRVIELAGDKARLLAVDLGREFVGYAAPGLVVGAEAAALIRPEHVTLETAAEADGLSGHIRGVVHLGEILAIRLVLTSGQDFWLRRSSGTDMPDEGRETRLAWVDRDGHLKAREPAFAQSARPWRQSRGANGAIQDRPRRFLRPAQDDCKATEK